MRSLILLLLVGTTFSLNGQVTANQPDPLRLCDDLASGSEFDELSFFDLTVVEPEVIGAQDPTNLEIAFFLSLADADANINAIFDPTQYLNVSNPQEVFIRLTNIVTTEFDVTSVTLIVYPLPTPVSPTPLEVCDDNNDGFAEFDLHSKDDEILEGMTDTSVLYYATQDDAETGDVGLALASPYTNVVPFFQTIYARVEFDVPPAPLPCYEIVELDLIVYIDCPIIDTEPEDIVIIEGDGDGLAIFDLTVNEALILGSQDPAIFQFTYHETSTGAIEGTDAIPNPEAYQNIGNPQPIFVRLTNVNNGTFIVTGFVIETDGVLSINDFDESEIYLAPNPASNTLVLYRLNDTMTYSVGIYDLSGRLVFQTEEQNVSSMNLDVSKLSPQLYILKISDGNNDQIHRFIRR